MYLTNYFKQILSSRAVKYLLIATILVSFVETLEHLFVMPFSLSTSQNLILWILSWPMYVSLLMPLCIFGALLGTFVELANTQELAIIQMYLSTKRLFFSLGAMVLGLTMILFLISGWLVPWTYGVQTNYAKELLSDLKMPKTLDGQFNNINIGDKKLVIYKDKKKKSGLFVATALKENQGLAIISTKDIDIDKKGGLSFLNFKKGHSYTFDKNSILRYVLEFDESQIPLDLSKGFGAKHKAMKMNMNQLYQNGGKLEKMELAWRIHTTLALAVLSIVAFNFSDYSLCRKNSLMVYFASLFTVILYYTLLMMIRARAQTYPMDVHIHFAYSLAHLVAIGFGWVAYKAVKALKVTYRMKK